MEPKKVDKLIRCLEEKQDMLALLNWVPDFIVRCFMWNSFRDIMLREDLRENSPYTEEDVTANRNYFCTMLHRRSVIDIV